LHPHPLKNGDPGPVGLFDASAQSIPNLLFPGRRWFEGGRCLLVGAIKLVLPHVGYEVPRVPKVGVFGHHVHDVEEIIVVEAEDEVIAGDSITGVLLLMLLLIM